MNIKQIKLLAEIMQTKGLTALEICEGEGKIRLERSGAAARECAPANAAAPNEPVKAEAETFKNYAPAADSVSAGAIDFNRITEVRSPMVGVFYTAPSPESEPYVKVGSKVKKGDVLCIIEAMKLMNEITAEVDGEIADICVQNGQVVEYSQVLFKIF